MFDANRLLGGLFSDALGRGAVGGVAGGLLGSVLVNKRARKALGGSAMKLGGAAALAGLAYYAYQNMQKGAAGAAPPPPPPPAGRAAPPPPPPAEAAAAAAPPEFLPPPERGDDCDDLARTMIHAMIAAAHADGRIDGEELKAVLDAVEREDIDAGQRSEILRLLNAPPTADDIAALADTPAHAMELYTASLATTGGDTPAEQAYLALLARKLRLEPGFVASVHAAADAPPPIG